MEAGSQARCGAVLCILLLAGCASMGRSPQGDALPVAAAPGVTATERVAVAAAVAPAEAPAAQERAGAAPQDKARPAASAPKPPVKVAPTPAVQAAKPDAPAPALAKQEGPPPLDLKSLEARLRETKAIGVFTKLTLKNQVDDLLERFRSYYQGGVKSTLAELRRSYDLLVLKVLALLQDADPPLAVAIASSRESIWGILSNRAKFAAV